MSDHKAHLTAALLMVGVLFAFGCNLTTVAPTALPTGETPTDRPETTPAPAAVGTAPPAATNAVSGEPVEDWVGTIVRNGEGAPYEYGFQPQEGTQRIGAAAADPGLQQQITALAGATQPQTVHIWGTVYHNPTNPAFDIVYITALDTETPTAAPQQPTAAPVLIPCTLPPRLTVGNSARVAPGPLPNAMRSAPGTGSDSAVLGAIATGTVFTVLDGPVCADGYNWWYVDAGGFVGWTAEGQDGEYWLIPLACANGMETRLTPGGQGRVTTIPDEPNTLRREPHNFDSSTVIGQIPPGGIFIALEGPSCGADGMAWWRVNYNGIVGWTPEGNGGVYWLEPYTPDVTEPIADLRGVIVGLDVVEPNSGADDYFQEMDQNGTRYGISSTDPALRQQIIGLRNTGTIVHVWGDLRRNVPDYNNMQINVTQIVIEAPTPVVCDLAPHLAVGYSAIVTPGLPNAVRASPGTGEGSTVLGSIPAGTIFRVEEGPVCADGYNWWRISASGISGWTAEGQNGEYWLEPLVCPNGLWSRLIPGQQGRVTTTPDLPNAVRSEPGGGGDSIVLGEIPPGGVFTVLEGPQCGPEGRTWWRVNYNGLIGWTAEGDPGEYWLEPLQ